MPRRARLTDVATRERVVLALVAGIENATTAALCFNPHHARRAVRGEHRVDLVICSEGSSIELPFDGNHDDDLEVATANDSKPVLDAIFGP